MGRKQAGGYRIGCAAGGVILAVALSVILMALVMRPSMEEWPRLGTLAAPHDDAVTLRFIGTSGFVLTDKDNTLVIDGFVTRPSLWQLVFTTVRADAARVRDVRRLTDVSSLDAVLVSHSHYDHAMDAPEWVKQAGGQVWGTASTRHVALAEDVHSVRVVSPAERINLGRFEVRIFRLDHAPPERMKGYISEGFQLPARVTDYKTGGGLGFYFQHGDCRILSIPSAGKVHADLSQYPADVVLLSVGQLGLQDTQKIHDYWQQTVVASGAKLVVPIHWDDFSRSLDEPLLPLPYGVERLDVAMREIISLADKDVRVALPVLFAPLDISSVGQC